jgi:hypothetical protein
MSEIDEERLLRHIAKSDLTAVEKRYPEELVRAGVTSETRQLDLPPHEAFKKLKGRMRIFDRMCFNCGAMCFDDGSYCPECGSKFI